MKVRVVVFFLAVLVTSCGLVPIYGYLGETSPILRGPKGWIDVPAHAPLTITVSHPEYEKATSKAIERLSEYRKKIGAPALTAAVVKQGELIWSAGAGWSDLNALSAVNPHDNFRIGSTSKAITATLLARLVQAGKVDLDREIGKTLTSLPNTNWATFTPRQLISHTSGLPGYGNNTDIVGFYHSLALNKSHSSIYDSLSYFDSALIRNAPGEVFYYSSFGTNLLAYYLEVIEDKTFDTLINDEILLPLSIRAPSMITRNDNQVQFYQINKKNNKVKLWRDIDLSSKIAGGGLISNVIDISKIGSAWLRDPHKLLPHIIHTLSDRPVSSTTELSTAKFALALADNIAYLY